MNHQRSNWMRWAAAAAVGGAVLFGTLPALAQETGRRPDLDLTAAPVLLHEGTCADPDLDAWVSVGRLAPTGPTDAGADLIYDEQGPLEEEDVFDEAPLDPGIDDGDGVVTDDEVSEAAEAAIGVFIPAFYVTEGEVDAEFAPLFGQPNVIAVHGGAGEGEIVACGNLFGIVADDEDEVAVGLRAVDGSQVRGYAVFERDPELFGDDVTAITVHIVEGLPSARERRASAGAAP